MKTHGCFEPGGLHEAARGRDRVPEKWWPTRGRGRENTEGEAAGETLN